MFGLFSLGEKERSSFERLAFVRFAPSWLFEKYDSWSGRHLGALGALGVSAVQTM
jgi:hypothetical protein